MYRSQDILSSDDAMGSPVDINTSGIYPSAENKIDITFHVLIPIKVWGWSDKCRVHLRFGHSKLGKWKKNIGNFILVR